MTIKSATHYELELKLILCIGQLKLGQRNIIQGLVHYDFLKWK